MVGESAGHDAAAKEVNCVLRAWYFYVDHMTWSQFSPENKFQFALRVFGWIFLSLAYVPVCAVRAPFLHRWTRWSPG